MEICKMKEFHNSFKKNYMEIAPKLWWGDDLDVRFYLLKQLMQIENKTILDVGCNIGLTLNHLKDSNEKYGIDIDKLCIEKAKVLNKGATILEGNMLDLPFDDNKFDVVILMNVMPYFEIKDLDKESYVEDFFKEAYRVLKPNGMIFMTTPNGDSTSYKGKGKIPFNQLTYHLDKLNLEYDLLGWCGLYSNRLIKSINHIPLLKYLVHPKILCRFEFVWRHLIQTMDQNINEAKYFYAIIKK